MSGSGQAHVKVISGSCQSNVRVMSGFCQGHVRVMSGSCQGHVRVISGSCLGYIRVLTGLCQSGLISIVQFTRRLETEGFSVLLVFTFVFHPENAVSFMQFVFAYFSIVF